MTAKPPAPPYVGPAYHTSAGDNMPIHRIVLHGTVSPCVPGNARAVARYFATPGSGGSAHYIADPGEVVQDVWDSVIAWHAPPNPNSLGIEMSDMETGDPKRWFDAPHTAMLKLVAELVVGLAEAYNVPLVKLSVADLLAGKHGLCGHVDVSNAWHQSDHTDPIGFPWDHFMQMVADVKGGGTGGGNPWPAFRSTSPAVGAMVAKLAANGYFTSGHRDKPNYYGTWTRHAIERLQASFDDTKGAPDGLIGPLTWAHIEALPDQPPAPPARKFPILDDPREHIGDAIRSLDVATEAHPRWQFGKDMRAALATYHDQLVNIQKP